MSLHVATHVVLKPVRAALVDQPEDYQWSSYLSALGEAAHPACLTSEWLLENFSALLPEARKKYRQFVHDGMKEFKTPWENLAGQIFLGTEKFLSRAKDFVGDREYIQEIPRTQRYVGRPAIESLFPPGITTGKTERNRLITLAHSSYGYTEKEIAHTLGVHYTTVSKAINNAGNSRFKT